MKVKSESKVNQSCPTLSEPMDCSLPGSSIHGIFQATVLYIMRIAGLDEAQAGIKISRRNNNNFRYADDTTLVVGSEEELKSLLMKVIAAKSLQLCPTLCDPIDVSPPGSPFPGILQARTLEWVAISFSNA